MCQHVKKQVLEAERGVVVLICEDCGKTWQEACQHPERYVSFNSNYTVIARMCKVCGDVSHEAVIYMANPYCDSPRQ